MTAGSNWCDQLDLLIRARTALIWIRSNEEARVEALLTQTANRLQHQLGCWDFINGLRKKPHCPILGIHSKSRRLSKLHF